jgi:hypothetical protein
MSENSILGGRIRIGSAYLYNREPVTALMYRDLANNAIHAQDQRNKVLVNWQGLNPIYDSDVSGGKRASLAYANYFYPLGVFGPVHCTRQTDGKPTALRIRAAVIRATAGGGPWADAEFRIVASPSAEIYLTNATDIVSVSGSSSPFQVLGSITGVTTSTPAWTNVSGSDAITYEIDSAWLRQRSTLSDTSGTPVAVETAEVYFTVYGKCVDEYAWPGLSALHIQEYL